MSQFPSSGGKRGSGIPRLMTYSRSTRAKLRRDHDLEEKPSKMNERQSFLICEGLQQLPVSENLCT